MLYKVNETINHSVCFACSETGAEGTWNIIEFHPKEIIAVLTKHPDVFGDNSSASLNDETEQYDTYNTFEIVSDRFTGFLRIDAVSFVVYFTPLEGTGKVQCYSE